MSSLFISPLLLNNWEETRNTLQKYCRMVGAIRETLSAPLKHSLHTNLLVCNKGFTTSLIPKSVSSSDLTFEVILDLENRKLVIESNFREPMRLALTGQSLNALCDETCSLLVDIGITPPLEKPSFLEGSRGCFDARSLQNYWDIVIKVDRVLNMFKSELNGETSPVFLRPDDLALVLIRFVNEDNFGNTVIDQEVEFGFSTGDDKVPDAYFYVSCSPVAALLEKIKSKDIRHSSIKDKCEMILPYSDVLKADYSEKDLLNFYRAALK